MNNSAVPPSSPLETAMAQARARVLAAPDNAALHADLARQLASAGKLEAALASAQRAAELDPGSLHSVLYAQLLQHSGKIDSAIAHLMIVIAAAPGLREAQLSLANAHLQAGQASEAVRLLRECITHHPAYADALVLLASMTLTEGSSGESLELLRRAISAEPGNAGAWLQLARARLYLGDAAGAEKCLRNAEKLLSTLPAHASWQMAGVLQERKAFDEAESYYLRAIDSDPANIRYRSNYADMLCSIGRIETGIEQHREILRREPMRLRSHLASRLTLQGVQPSEVALQSARRRFSDGLSELEEMAPAFRQLPRQQIEADICWSNYLLAYHGEDDLLLQKRFAAFQRSLHPSDMSAVERVPRRRDANIRIGFASSFLYQCTVGWYFSSWIRDLDRARFDVHLYALGPIRDGLTAQLAQGSTLRAAHHLPFFQLAELIRQDELDVLVFPELGLCPITYSLAGLRLAPLQCAGWGHPVTSGHQNVDLYFSCADMEPPEAASHYCERLHLLPGLGTRYLRPTTSQDFSRQALGLPVKGPLALVSQSLFKLHPENDALVCAVLEACPALHLVMYADSFQRNTDMFRQRLLSSAEQRNLALERRITFLPRMNREQFLAVNRHCTVMLDSLHWSGGNTSLDAIASGLPVITLPGRFMRGRQSRAMLRTLDCAELIAADATQYVALAQSVVENEALRESLRRRLLGNGHLLFERGEGPAAFQQAIIEEVTRLRQD